jgi:hypothetical protein
MEDTSPERRSQRGPDSVAALAADPDIRSRPFAVQNGSSKVNAFRRGALQSEVNAFINRAEPLPPRTNQKTGECDRVDGPVRRDRERARSGGTPEREMGEQTMNRRARIAARATTALLGVLLAAGTAPAETLFAATLDASQNVPPTGSGGTGTAVLILNDAATEVAYTVTYDGLEGVEIGAHFHRAPPGENGSILHSLPLGTPKLGVWEVTAHDVADLMAGMVYVNIHTDMYPSGEIRGDISQSTAAVSEEPLRLSWGRIKALFE